MKHIDRKRDFWATLVTVASIGLLVGVLFLVLRAELLLKIVSVVLGIVTLLSAVPDLVSGLIHISTRYGVISFVLALITGVIGVVLIFSGGIEARVVVDISYIHSSPNQMEFFLLQDF